MAVDANQKPVDPVHDVLRRLVTSQGKLFSRVRSNLHAKHQRELRQAVLRARVLALLPFVAR